jgi:hypothetical protein
VPYDDPLVQQVNSALALDDLATRVERLLGYPNGAVPAVLRQMAARMLTDLIHPARALLRANN